jgi:hypothetical protein
LQPAEIVIAEIAADELAIGPMHNEISWRWEPGLPARTR